MRCKMTGNIELGGAYCLHFSLRRVLFELSAKIFLKLTIVHERFIKYCSTLQRDYDYTLSGAEIFGMLLAFLWPSRTRITRVEFMYCKAHFCPQAQMLELCISASVGRRESIFSSKLLQYCNSHILQRWQARPGDEYPLLLPGAKPPGGGGRSPPTPSNRRRSLLFDRKSKNVLREKSFQTFENGPALLYMFVRTLKIGYLENHLPNRISPWNFALFAFTFSTYLGDTEIFKFLSFKVFL